MRQLLDRIGTAFRILIGREPTWWGIQSEWAEIQMGAADLFQKHNALAARLAKQIKQLGEAQEEDCGCEEEEARSLPLKARKAALRRRAFGGGFAPRPSPNPGNGEAPDIPPEGRWVPAEQEADA